MEGRHRGPDHRYTRPPPPDREMSNGHIRQRSPGSWELRYTIDGKTRTATVRGTRRDAEKELRKRLVTIDNGGVADATKLTTGQWLHQGLGVVKSELSPPTLDHCQRAVTTHLKRRLGDVPLAKLSRVQVQQLFSDLAEGGRADGKSGPLAPTSRKQIYAVLNIALGRRGRSPNDRQQRRAGHAPPHAEGRGGRD